MSSFRFCLALEKARTSLCGGFSCCIVSTFSLILESLMIYSKTAPLTFRTYPSLGKALLIAIHMKRYAIWNADKFVPPNYFEPRSFVIAAREKAEGSSGDMS
jgi:hypothetical protein